MLLGFIFLIDQSETYQLIDGGRKAVHYQIVGKGMLDQDVVVV